MLYDGIVTSAPACQIAGEEQRNAIAVLPLQNMNGDFNIDYLRFALADELTSVLTSEVPRLLGTEA